MTELRALAGRVSKATTASLLAGAAAGAMAGRAVGRMLGRSVAIRVPLAAILGRVAAGRAAAGRRSELRWATSGFTFAGAALLLSLLLRVALAVAGRFGAPSCATTSCATMLSFRLFDAAEPTIDAAPTLVVARGASAVGQAIRAAGCSGASFEGPNSRETTSSARLLAPFVAALVGTAARPDAGLRAATGGWLSLTTRKVSPPRAPHNADPQNHKRAKADAHRRRFCRRPPSLKSPRTSMFSSRSGIKCWQ